MHRRFLGLVAAGRAPLASLQVRMVREAARGLAPLMQTDRLVLWSDCGIADPRFARQAIVGLLHDRGAVLPQRDLTNTAWSEIAASRGRRLVERCWGSYVAFTCEGNQTRIVRAPLGDLGCYYRRSGNDIVIASDLALLSTIGQRPAIDDEALARHIAWPEWRQSETCLDGVRELRGGDRLIIASEIVAAETIWSPWPFIARESMIESPQAATRAVRDAVRLAVHARVADCHRLVLLLSGGLDLSIVAASLAHANADFTCLNLIGDDAASDEYRYAQKVAHRLGAAILTRTFAADRIDVGRSGAAQMPYPVHRCFTQAQDAIAEEVARQVGADAVIDGGGGDNVFLASRTVAILADCLRESGFDRRFWNTARSLGDLGQTGMVRLAWRAAHRAWLRSPAPRQQRGDDFLSGAARAIIDAAPPHPWFVPPDTALPGRARHVALLAPAQNLVEAINAQAPIRAISPLVSQPVIEACLRVPSWLWLEPGRDRAVARRAFADDLPEAIVNRRSKGTPTGFVAAIFDSHRAEIRDLLMGGYLAGHGILDCDRLAQILDVDGPVRSLRFVRVMELLDAEVWARAQL